MERLAFLGEDLESLRRFILIVCLSKPARRFKSQADRFFRRGVNEGLPESESKFPASERQQRHRFRCMFHKEFIEI